MHVVQVLNMQYVNFVPKVLPKHKLIFIFSNFKYTLINNYSGGAIGILFVTFKRYIFKIKHLEQLKISSSALEPYSTMHFLFYLDSSQQITYTHTIVYSWILLIKVLVPPQDT